MLTIDENAVLPSSEVIRQSIRGMKAELHLAKFNLNNHTQRKKKDDKYYRTGAKMALKVNRLEKLIRQMEFLELKAMISEIKKAA